MVQAAHTGGSCTLTSVVKDAFRNGNKRDVWQLLAADQRPIFTHISATGYVFYIIFGATAGLHIA